MIGQPQALPPKPSAISISTPYDVQWGKPVFRAPDLASRVTISNQAPFTPVRATELRRTAK